MLDVTVAIGNDLNPDHQEPWQLQFADDDIRHQNAPRVLSDLGNDNWRRRA